LFAGDAYDKLGLLGAVHGGSEEKVTLDPGVWRPAGETSDGKAGI
jgi:hypothetical protein